MAFLHVPSIDLYGNVNHKLGLGKSNYWLVGTFRIWFLGESHHVLGDYFALYLDLGSSQMLS